jgi:hypothetical protein
MNLDEMQGPSERLIQAVAVTAELMGRTFSPAAARAFVADLAMFPEAAVLEALTRTRREVRGLLTVADVMSRIDDGRPAADEAFAMLPFDEGSSVVWTEEMACAWGAALPLVEVGDKVGARLAFRERYTHLVNAARAAGIPPKWSPSLGHDASKREAALVEAVRLGRLRADHAGALLPFRLELGTANLMQQLLEGPA